MLGSIVLLAKSANKRSLSERLSVPSSLQGVRSCGRYTVSIKEYLWMMKFKLML